MSTPVPFTARSGSSRCSGCIYGTGGWSTENFGLPKFVRVWIDLRVKAFKQ